MSTLIRCPPYCRSNCVIHHHPLLVALLNCKDTDNATLMQERLQALQNAVNKYKQDGKWTMNSRIPDGIDAYHFTMVHWACALGRTRAIQWLKDNGFNMKVVTSEEKDTGLHRALFCLQETCPKEAAYKFQCLLPIMEDVLLMRNANGNTPLHQGCENFHLEMSRPDFYAECINEMLQYAHKKNKDLLRKMLASKNNKKYTPLHILCQHDRNISLIKILIAMGAEISVSANSEEQAPLDVAINAGQMKIAHMLSNLVDQQVQDMKNNPRRGQREKFPSVRLSVGAEANGKQTVVGSGDGEPPTKRMRASPKPADLNTSSVYSGDKKPDSSSSLSNSSLNGLEVNPKTHSNPSMVDSKTDLKSTVANTLPCSELSFAKEVGDSASLNPEEITAFFDDVLQSTTCQQISSTVYQGQKTTESSTGTSPPKTAADKTTRSSSTVSNTSQEQKTDSIPQNTSIVSKIKVSVTAADTNSITRLRVSKPAATKQNPVVRLSAEPCKKVVLSPGGSPDAVKNVVSPGGSQDVTGADTLAVSSAADVKSNQFPAVSQADKDTNSKENSKSLSPISSVSSNKNSQRTSASSMVVKAPASVPPQAVLQSLVENLRNQFGSTNAINAPIFYGPPNEHGHYQVRIVPPPNFGSNVPRPTIIIRQHVPLCQTKPHQCSSSPPPPKLSPQTKNISKDSVKNDSGSSEMEVDTVPLDLANHEENDSFVSVEKNITEDSSCSKKASDEEENTNASTEEIGEKGTEEPSKSHSSEVGKGKANECKESDKNPGDDHSSSGGEAILNYFKTCGMETKSLFRSTMLKESKQLEDKFTELEKEEKEAIMELNNLQEEQEKLVSTICDLLKKVSELQKEEAENRNLITTKEELVNQKKNMLKSLNERRDVCANALEVLMTACEKK